MVQNDNMITTEGQSIMKCLFGVFNFFQKLTKTSQLEDILHYLPAAAAAPTSIGRFGGSTSIAVRPPSKVEVVAGALLAIPISRPPNQSKINLLFN